MKRIAYMLVLLCAMSCHGATDWFYDLSNPTWTLSGGQYFASYGGSPTPPGPYAWDTAYSDSVGLYELEAWNALGDTSFIGTNVLILGGAPAIPTGIPATGGVSRCLSFDGGDSATTAGKGDFDFRTNTSFTVMGWVRKQCTSGTIAGNSANSGANTGWFFGIGGSAPASAGLLRLFGSTSGQSLGVQAATVLPSNVLCHVAATYDGTRKTNGIRIYYDGVLQKSATVDNDLATSIAANRVLMFGSSETSGGNPFTGWLDRMTIYKRVLTAAEVATNFWVTAAPVTTNMGHGWTKWDYDNRNGDYLKLACHLPMNYGNQVASGTTPDVSTNRVPAIYGGSADQVPTLSYNDHTAYLTFDGITDRVYVTPTPASADSCSNFTLSAWINRPSTSGTWGWIMSKGPANAAEYTAETNDLGLLTDGTGSNVLVLVRTDNSSYGTTTEGVLPSDTWVNLTMVYDGSQTTNSTRLKLYKNGRPVSMTYTGTIRNHAPKSVACLTLGINFTVTTLFKGSVDDVLFFAGNGSQYSMTQTQATNIFLKSKANYNL